MDKSDKTKFQWNWNFESIFWVPRTRRTRSKMDSSIPKMAKEKGRPGWAERRCRLERSRARLGRKNSKVFVFTQKKLTDDICWRMMDDGCIFLFWKRSAIFSASKERERLLRLMVRDRMYNLPVMTSYRFTQLNDKLSELPCHRFHDFCIILTSIRTNNLDLCKCSEHWWCPQPASSLWF